MLRQTNWINWIIITTDNFNRKNSLLPIPTEASESVALPWTLSGAFRLWIERLPRSFTLRSHFRCWGVHEPRPGGKCLKHRGAQDMATCGEIIQQTSGCFEWQFQCASIIFCRFCSLVYVSCEGFWWRWNKYKQITSWLWTWKNPNETTYKEMRISGLKHGWLLGCTHILTRVIRNLQ